MDLLKEWINAHYILLVGFTVLVVVLAIWSAFKKLKRMAYSLFSIKALLLLALFGFDYNTPTPMSLAPAAFVKVLTSFTVDYGTDQATFSNHNGITGTIGYQANTLSLSVVAEAKSPDTVSGFLQLIKSFSGLDLGVQAAQLLKQKVNKKIAIQRGYIEVKGSLLHVYIDKSI